ncbi:MAG: sensor histidine kinase KdpD [Thermomicrobiales bacterium]
MPTADEYAPPGFIPLSGELRRVSPSGRSAGDIASEQSRGALRIYLGAAPGVGKTYAMLREAHRLRAEGYDVVIGFVETHGRAETAAQIGDLEVVPRRVIDYHGVQIEEMDTDAVLARKPDIAIVDELAHTNAPGSSRERRWQDVEVLRDAGIDIIGALNVQHIASIHDVVADLTGISVRETVPDRIVEEATEIQLVDLPVNALIERIEMGKVYPPEQAERARAHFFQPGTLNALRELALRHTAKGVDDRLEDLMLGEATAEPPAAAPLATTERIVVLMDDSPGWGDVLRRAWRLASVLHGELVVLDPGAGQTDTHAEIQRRRSRELALDLGARIDEVPGAADSGEALVRALASLRPGSFLMGVTRESKPRRRWFGPSQLPELELAARVIRDLPATTVQLVSMDADTGPKPWRDGP